jgi:hypothetical protein
MTITLTPLQNFQGALTFIFVLISILLGLSIISKFFKYQTRQYLLVGLTWIFLISPYWPDAISFITILLTGNQLNEASYFFIANAFIAPIHIIWIMVISEFLYKSKQKLLLGIFSAEAIVYESIFLITFFTDFTLIGTRISPFYVEWALFIDIYLIASIVLFLTTGILFARRSIQSSDEIVQLKGKLLILAFITFTIGTFLDVAIELTEITLLIARIFVIIAAFSFYFGFSLPDRIKNLILK